MWKFQSFSFIVRLIVLFVTCNAMIISAIQMWCYACVLILMLQTSRPLWMINFFSGSAPVLPIICRCTFVHYISAHWYEVGMKSSQCCVNELDLFFCRLFSRCHYFCTYSMCVCVLCVKLVNLIIKFELTGWKFSFF